MARVFIDPGSFFGGAASGRMKLGILTSIETRHRYFANRLCVAFDAVAVGYEQVGYSPARVERIIRALRALETGSLPTMPQWNPPSARLYLRKDYHPRQVVTLYEKIKDGLICRYVMRAASDRPSG
jgi:hypothetical protein